MSSAARLGMRSARLASESVHAQQPMKTGTIRIKKHISHYAGRVKVPLTKISEVFEFIEQLKTVAMRNTNEL